MKDLLTKDALKKILRKTRCSLCGKGIYYDNTGNYACIDINCEFHIGRGEYINKVLNNRKGVVNQ